MDVLVIVSAGDLTPTERAVRTYRCLRGARVDSEIFEPFAPRPSVCATGHPSHSRTLGLAASDSFCRDRPALRHYTSLSLARAFAQ